MSVLPPELTRSMMAGERGAMTPVSALVLRWEELHELATEVAHLAKLTPELSGNRSDTLAAHLGCASEWQRALAQQGIEDIEAMMQPGLFALRVIQARGQDPAVPAIALWREFHAARQALLDIVTNKPVAEALDAA